MRKIKILFYFTHKESLGHTTRILNIIQSIKNIYNKYVDIYVFQGGKLQSYLHTPKGISWFDLPYPYYSKLNFKKGSSHYFVPLYSRIRANYMLSKIKEIKPNIFITEFFPFGREENRFELLPVLKYLKDRGSKIFASIGYPYLVQDNIKILSFYSKFYDYFMIHTPKDLEFPYLYKNITNPILKSIYKKVFNLLSDKIIYTGYILPLELEENKNKNYLIDKLKTQKKKLVFVSRGGGVIYPKIIINSIIAKKYLSEDFIFLIIAGPSSSKRELKLFKDLIKESKSKNITLFKYVSNFLYLLRESDISISMAGYNTSVQLLYFRKKSIVIPSSVDPEIAIGYCSEQLSRAQILKKYLNSDILDYNSMTAKDISNAIERKISQKNTNVIEIDNNWFNGNKITTDFLMDYSYI